MNEETIAAGTQSDELPVQNPKVQIPNLQLLAIQDGHTVFQEIDRETGRRIPEREKNCLCLPLWASLPDLPGSIPEPKEEDVLAQQYHLANQATLAEVEAIGALVRMSGIDIDSIIETLGETRATEVMAWINAI